MNIILTILTICFYTNVDLQTFIHKSGFVKIITMSDQQEYETFYLDHDVYIFQDEIYQHLYSCYNEGSCR